MSTDDINTALENLRAIKSGSDPRPQEEAAVSTKRLLSDDALEVVKAEVDRLYDENPDLRYDLSRRSIDCGVARWSGRNGYWKAKTTFGGKRRFNKRITQTKKSSNNHIIVINEKILEQGNRDEFLDTVRHEVAHAVTYAIHDDYPSRKKHHDYDPHLSGHGKAWKNVASFLGADASSCHNKRDRSDEYKYYVGCTNCGMTSGKTKRSKSIKQPFTRKCNLCGQSPLVSFDAGDDMPDEPGTVAVQSLPWGNRKEWRDNGCP